MSLIAAPLPLRILFRPSFVVGCIVLDRVDGERPLTNREEFELSAALVALATGFGVVVLAGVVAINVWLAGAPALSGGASIATILLCSAGSGLLIALAGVVLLGFYCAHFCAGGDRPAMRPIA